MYELLDVHKQRIALAVKARCQGEIVKFRINPETVVRYTQDQPRTQHVICNGYGRMEPWLERIQAEYQRQCAQVETR